MQATRKLASFLKPYRLWAILAPLLMMLEVVMDLMQPKLLQRIIDQGIANQQLELIVHTGGLMVAIALVGYVGGMGCTIFAVMASQGMGADLRQALMAKIQALSFGNLDDLETGKLVTRLTNDVTQIQEIVLIMLRMMVRIPMLLFGSLVMGTLTSPRLAPIFVLLIPVVTVLLAWVINRSYPMFGRVQGWLDALNTVMQENLAGVRVVKAFVRAGYEIDRFGRTNDRLMEQNITAIRTITVTMPGMMFALNVGVVSALWLGGIQINAGGMEVGQLIAFINYLTQTLMSLVMMSMLVMRVSRAEASAVRIHEVLDSQPLVQDKPDAVADFSPRGRVAFEQVRFRYDDPDGQDGGDAVLRDLSFVAEPGATVAILGATGAGKSSLVHLIPRFYDVTGGRVTVDGVDVRDLDNSALRRQVGIALQEAVLFSGSIRDNIRYGRTDATDAQVERAARLAQAHDFIMALPGGYDAVVGQRGVNLSGGQRQRLAIARALLIEPAILILDDSTSAVDVETEARIQAGLTATRHTQTRFVVAQRISSVLGADKILVLDDGRIVAQGTHASLLAASPIYREIYASQMENGTVNHGAVE